MHLLNVCIYFKIDYSTYFKDVIQYYYCQFSPVSAPLIEVFNNRNYFSVFVRIIVACERQTFLLAHRETSPKGDERGETSAVRRLV